MTPRNHPIRIAHAPIRIGQTTWYQAPKITAYSKVFDFVEGGVLFRVYRLFPPKYDDGKELGEVQTYLIRKKVLPSG
jgi:hypothetical protein